MSRPTPWAGPRAAYDTYGKRVRRGASPGADRAMALIAGTPD
jgi:hypothetical protein